MLSTVKYITPNINNQLWNIGNDIGHNFEDHIYKSIVKILNASFSNDIRIFMTPATRDDGRDVVIESNKDIELFGNYFSLKGKNKIVIYIECKSSSKNLISYEKVAKNTIIAGQDKVDYLVLVTNQTIAPYTYYSICENSEMYGYEFILVDQYILYQYLHQNNLNIWSYKKVENIPSNISLSYQICKGNYHRKPYFDLYLFCRNYSSEIAECKLNLVTDRNWHLSEDNLCFILDKNKGKCISLRVYKEFSDGLDDVILRLTCNNNLNIIQLEGTSLSYNFELPLTGYNHKQIIHDISNQILENPNFSWVNLYGEAGIGKTRIIDELSKNFSERSIRILNTICIKNSKKSTFDSIKMDISKNLRKNISASNLYELICEIQDEFIWTVLFVEDIHNADSDFLNMLKDLIKQRHIKGAFLLVTAGRDDYTVYNTEFFAVLECLQNTSNKAIKNYRVEPFKDEECLNLIKRIIKDIPLHALTKIHEMSGNNPFYLIQFIEYLLEIRLVNLLNRNTVGIPNILTFSEKIYIPREIEKLIKLRYEILGLMHIGNKLQKFLLVAALYGLKFPKKLMLNFFDNDEYNAVEILFSNHFLVEIDEDTLKFDHETIYLFIKKMWTTIPKKQLFEVCSDLESNSQLMYLFNKQKQGIVLFYLKQYAEAKNKFEEPINEIQKMDNVSSENISDKYFEYYTFIYEIAKHDKNTQLMEKTIFAKIYVAMHNLSLGQATKTFDETFMLLESYHKLDEKKMLEVKQLQASFYLHVGMISKARGIMNDLLSKERIDPTKFDENIRFNLFERAASLYIHTNHVAPAIQYNKLSFDIASSMHNNKLKALAKINEAKLYFFTNTIKSHKLMLEADSYLKKDMVDRINCHNKMGLLTADIVLSNSLDMDMPNYISRAEKLLDEAIKVNYPLDIIRGHFLLALLYFMDTSEETYSKCKTHLEYGIDTSIRYGILKLMGNYYNLKALIAIKEKQNVDYITSLYDTMVDYLRQEDLLFLGNLDFSYSNIILLTNYLIYLDEYGLENKMYEFLSKLTYYGYNSDCDYQCNNHLNCHYTCLKDRDIFKKNFQKVKEGSLLLVDPKFTFSLKFDDYFIPIYL